MTDFKQTLVQLTQNLNLLHEREAKYGGNAPLELLNQIEDHQTALTLTEQALKGELSEAAWREALNPLLLAIHKGQVIHLQVETYIAGEVRGDFVGGDKVEGDKVLGDKIITHIYEAPPPPLPPAEAKERRELGILLATVRQFWIEGVLEKSVHQVALIDLGKETQAEAVAHAWEQVLELPDQSRQTLPPDKKISQIFDEMNRALLILGAPGSGKTITLLQLARDLIYQAEQDESFNQAVPVIFNLSTWTKGQKLINWLAVELSAKYQIPQQIGRPWLENNRLLPLLDGLDEVRLADRDDCVKAINQFGVEFGLSGLVVCSRLEEYTCLPVRLKLNGAIRLQPLTLEQVYDYLEAAGSKLDALRAALQADDSLKTLAQNPLTLGIMTLAYQELSPESLVSHAHTLEARRQHLLDTYIERMFKRKGKKANSYPDRQTRNWLSWLAQQMLRYNQSVFLIEQLQPGWLVSQSWSWAYLLASRIIFILIFGLVLGLMYGAILARVFGVTNALMPGFGGWMTFVLPLGVVTGLLLALVDGIWYRLQGKNTLTQKLSAFQQRILKMGVYGLILGIGTGLLSSLLAEFWIGLFNGAATTIFLGPFFGLSNSRQSLSKDIRTVEALAWSWRRGSKAVLMGLGGGFLAGVMFGWIGFQNADLLEFTRHTPFVELFGERWFVLGSGLLYGVWGGILGLLFGGLASKIVQTKIRPNQGMWLTLRNALLTGPGFGFLVASAGWLLFGLAFGHELGRASALTWGLTIATLAFASYSGFDVISHYILRLLLTCQGRMPLAYAAFLDYAAERIFLQKVGGGYIFIHRLLLEHFATLEEE